MIEIELPTTEKRIRELKVGDEAALTGQIVTARDAAHKYMVEEKPEELRDFLRGSVIYHCGPIMKKTDEGWKVVAAGPTTSIREEPYEADVIKEYGVVGIIGKGGMGDRTLEACSEYGAVYFHAIGGLAVVLAESIKKVKKVFKLEEFGTPEALWVLEVERFPVVVTMDSYGQSLHRKVEQESSEAAGRILEIKY